MTDREARAAEAARLWDLGLNGREIAERMGVAVTTAYSYLEDPDGARLKARKDSYGGICESCGSPTTGCEGPGRAPTVCAECIQWSDQEILDAIRRWASEHKDTPPRTVDWQAGRGEYPHATVVIGRMGWNNAIIRAGFRPRGDKRPETQAEIEQLIRDGWTLDQVGKKYGVTGFAIAHRLKRRGLSVRKLRETA